MSKIRRCPHCIALVYRRDTTCHHCGGDLRRSQPRILDRRSILFIFFVVGVFAIADAIYLTKERSKRQIHDTSLMREFIEEDLLAERTSGSDEPRWSGADSLSELRAEFRRLMGDDPKAIHGRPEFLGSADDPQVPSSLHGIGARKYLYHLEWRTEDGRQSHKLPIWFALTGDIGDTKVVFMNWGGRSERRGDG